MVLIVTMGTVVEMVVLVEYILEIVTKSNVLLMVRAVTVAVGVNFIPVLPQPLQRYGQIFLTTGSDTHSDNVYSAHRASSG